MKAGIDYIGVGIGAMILRDKKLLLMLRKGAHGENTWALPGGRMEINESFEQTIVRECEEELGIKIKPLKLCSISNDIGHGTHWVTVVVVSEITSGEPKIMEPHKCAELKWFSIDNLPSNLFIPSANAIKNYLNRQMR